MPEHTGGEWKSKMTPSGERIIYVETETGIEVICRDIRHWNTSLVKSSPALYEALKVLHKVFFMDIKVAYTPEQNAALSQAFKILDEAEGK